MLDFAKYKDRLLDYLATKDIEIKDGRCRCFSGWHEDKNPSCKVTKNAFRCYSCGTFGNIYDAVMLIENLPPDRKMQFNFLEKHFSRYYKCASCGGIFEKGWADSEAVDEQKMIFPGVPLCDCELVCDDCFKEAIVCDCIEHKEAELRKATGDPEAFIETIFDITEKRRGFTAKGFYRTKVLGIFRKNFSLSYLNFDYCPFCGKKYDDPPGVKFCRIKMKCDKRTREMDFNKGQIYPAYVNKHGRVYLQDLFGEKVFLKLCDYVECPSGEEQ